MSEPLVTIDGLHLSLVGGAGPVNILCGIDLSVELGETISIVGPSGAGKTTLLMALSDLERPTAGRVRVAGTVRLLDRAAVADYFARRPRGSQIGAHASQQSRPVADRAELAAAYDELTARFEGQDVPVPEEWGGYLVVPEVVEFWQGRPGRMHDRLVYRRHGDGWTTQRLAP